MFNPIICVDFDGVIHSYISAWKAIDVIPDEPVPGAIEWLKNHLPEPPKSVSRSNSSNLFRKI